MKLCSRSLTLPPAIVTRVAPMLIDDLADVKITTRKRAPASRPHQLVKLDVEGRTHGNVWVFLAAPSWIGQ